MMTNSSTYVLSVGLDLMSKFNYIWRLGDIEKVKKNGKKVFSCFSCGGGSTMGYKLAGYDVIGNCEIDPQMNKIYLQNNHPKYNFNMDMRDFLALDEYPKELHDLDILDGSPPCSTFSMAGDREAAWGKEKVFREGQKKQRLDDLFFVFIDLVKKLRPKVAVAENVKGLLAKNAKGYVNEIIKQFSEAGYNVQIFLLNAAVMGVPQLRERVFFICIRKDLNLPGIKLEYHEDKIIYKDFADNKYGKKLNEDTETYKRWLQRSANDRDIGETLKNIHAKRSMFTQKYQRMNDVPYTLTASQRPLRFDVPYFISDKDVITIQTFPQDYDFMDADSEYVCGMSVPPVMMAHIASDIYEQLLKHLGGN